MARAAVGERPAVALPKPDGPAADASDSPQAIRALVVKLAWPSIVENMLQSVFNIAIMLMVERLGSAAIAGVGASTQLIMVAMSAFFALSMGTTVLVAHATGARNRAAADLAAKQSLILGVGIGLVITLLGVAFAAQAIAALGAGDEVVEEGARF